MDVTGLIKKTNSLQLAFVECKVGPITLRDVGQLLGYSLVARPTLSFLISPRGLTDRLATLLLTFGRTDILNYSNGCAICLAVWDIQRHEADLSGIVPRGSL